MVARKEYKVNIKLTGRFEKEKIYVVDFKVTERRGKKQTVEIVFCLLQKDYGIRRGLGRLGYLKMKTPWRKLIQTIEIIQKQELSKSLIKNTEKHD